jgi:hypothetical protein
MKVKTNDLTDVALDWAVAEADGTPIYRSGKTLSRMDVDGVVYWQPSFDWSQGGPIIERECIQLAYRVGVNWTATRVEGSSVCEVTVPYNQKGRAQLIAAMRCYVMSQLGDDVDVPEELK